MSRPDPQTDPTGYVLAVADQREQRSKAIGALGGLAAEVHPDGRAWVNAEHPDHWHTASMHGYPRLAEHIAAEANPGHALTEVALWRGIAERHIVGVDHLGPFCVCCWSRGFPCPDLLAVGAAAKAYAGDT